jgi:hypothetical protein
MRTKTLALSAVLGMLGTASLVAQQNVYSLNAVGYINVTLPVGYSVITCPLICGVSAGVSPGTFVTNDLNVLFPASNSLYNGASVLTWNQGGVGFVTSDNYAAGSWANGGNDISLPPGTAVFFGNGTGATLHATFVGTVPQGSLTNTLVPGYNLVGSMVPTSGDMTLNTIMNGGNANGFGPNGPGPGDNLLFWIDGAGGYGGNDGNPGFNAGSWSSGAGPDGTGSAGTPYFGPGGNPFDGVTTGFFYDNNNSTFNWVESFTINP